MSIRGGWPSGLAIACAVTVSAPSARAHIGAHAQIEALDRELALRPDDASVLVSRAELHRRAGHVMDAFVDAENAVLVASDTLEPYLERGLALEGLGARAAAEDDLDTYLDGGGRSTDAHAAKARLAAADGRIDEARSALDAAIALRPTPDLVVARGDLDESQGDFDEAARGYERGLTLLAGAHVVRMRLQRVSRIRGDFERAEQLLEEALSKVAGTSGRAELLLARAQVYAAAGRRAQASADRHAALAEIDASLETRSTDLRRVLRARALLSLDRTREARLELEGVLSRSPGLSDARRLLTEIVPAGVVAVRPPAGVEQRSR